MTTGTVRENATGRRIATTSGTNTTWRVYDGSGIPLTSDFGLPTSALGNRYLFQGREYSWATHVAWGGAGLYNFRARWYDPLTGRWLSNDPIGISGGLNQYAFCANNPVMFVDPEGTLDKRATVEQIAEVVEAGKYLAAVGAVGNASAVPGPGAMNVYKFIDAGVQVTMVAHLKILQKELENTFMAIAEASSPSENARLSCWYNRVLKVRNIIQKYFD